MNSAADLIDQDINILSASIFDVQESASENLAFPPLAVLLSS